MQSSDTSASTVLDASMTTAALPLDLSVTCSAEFQEAVLAFESSEAVVERFKIASSLGY